MMKEPPWGSAALESHDQGVDGQLAQLARADSQLRSDVSERPPALDHTLNRLGLIRARKAPSGPPVCHTILLGCLGSLQNPPLHRCCWRIRRVQAGCAMSRTKADWRVRASGVPASQAATRTRLRAAAVSTCWRWTFAKPM